MRVALAGDVELASGGVEGVGPGDRPATEAYVARATGRAAFRKAQADQIGLFEAADAKRTDQGSL